MFDGTSFTGRSRRPSGADADDRSGPRHVGQPRRRRSSGGVENGAFEGVVEAMDNDALLSAHDELMNAIMEEEEELVATHRKEIEEGMEILREVGSFESSLIPIVGWNLPCACLFSIVWSLREGETESWLSCC